MGEKLDEQTRELTEVKLEKVELEKRLRQP